MEISDFASEDIYIDKKSRMIICKEKPLELKINKENINGYGKNKFTEGRIDFRFDDWVLKTLQLIDCAMIRNLKIPEGYRPLSKRYVSCKCSEELKHQPIQSVLMSFTKIWNIDGKVGVTPQVKITYEDRQLQQPDDIFID